EESVAVTRDDEGVDVAVGFQVVDQSDQTDQALVGPDVGWRIRQRDDGGMTPFREGQPGVRQVAHRIVSVAWSWSIRRAMITRMISLVPSRIWWTRTSRR